MQPWATYSGCRGGKTKDISLLTVLILSTSGSVSMAVAPVEPSELPPTVRCSLDVERGRKGGRKTMKEKEWRQGREGEREGEREGGRTKS